MSDLARSQSEPGSCLTAEPQSVSGHSPCDPSRGPAELEKARDAALVALDEALKAGRQDLAMYHEGRAVAYSHAIMFARKAAKESRGRAKFAYQFGFANAGTGGAAYGPEYIIARDRALALLGPAQWDGSAEGDETEGLSPEDDSPVGVADAPSPQSQESAA